MEKAYIRAEDGWDEVEFMGLFPVQKPSGSDIVAVVKWFEKKDGRVSGYLSKVDIRDVRFVTTD